MVLTVKLLRPVKMLSLDILRHPVNTPLSSASLVFKADEKTLLINQPFHHSSHVDRHFVKAHHIHL